MLETFTNEKDWIEASVQFFGQVINNNNEARIAISGGKTPEPVYEALAEAELDFSGTKFYQVDERYVLENDLDSNKGMIMDSLKKAVAAGAEFHHFDTTLPIPEALENYQKTLEEAVPFDLCVLGIGTDGHIASLFRRGSAIFENKKLVANTHTYEFAVYDRLTITFPAIMPSQKLLLLVAGKNKKEVIEELLHKDFSIEDFPAKKLLEHPDLTIYFGDY